MVTNQDLRSIGPRTEPIDVLLMKMLLICHLKIHICNYHFVLLSTLVKEVGNAETHYCSESTKNKQLCKIVAITISSWMRDGTMSLLYLHEGLLAANGSYAILLYFSSSK